MSILGRNSAVRHERVFRTAADYVARLYSGSMTEAEEMALYRWLDEAPEHQREYDLQLAIWDQYDLPADDLGDETKVQQAVAEGYSLWWRAAAACLAFAFVGAGAFYGDIKEMLFPEHGVLYSTAIGEQKRIALADGSVIMLNTNSQIEVSFGADAREVVLEKGEAFFEVSADARRPFHVQTGEQRVTVLGTKFNVDKRGSRYTVAVVEGLVAVHPDDQQVRLGITEEKVRDKAPFATSGQYRLGAGTILSFNGDETQIARSALEGEGKYRPWLSGVVTFNQEPLSAVVAELSRYTSHEISIPEPETAKMNISGVFHMRELESVLMGLDEAFPLDVYQEGNRIKIVKQS